MSGTCSSADGSEWALTALLTPNLWFELTIPATPTRFTQLTLERQLQDLSPDERADEVHDAAQAAWEYPAGAALSCIWRRCLAAMNDGPIDRGARIFGCAQRLSAGLRLVAQQLDGNGAARWRHARAVVVRCLANELLAAPEVPSCSPREAATTGYTLFFDGGSRCNPDPGGSGSVIVRAQLNDQRAKHRRSRACSQTTSGTGTTTD
ncbi:hypothetical protein PybrP1_010611 [[Pythium] brassicae (nom. inval.)]|nr:hypothetical protein PybrP1_010611 [[Pythium] brassicae (nom. inval.)]